MVDFPNDESQSDDEEFGCTVSDDDVDESNINEMGMAVFADVPCSLMWAAIMMMASRSLTMMWIQRS